MLTPVPQCGATVYFILIVLFNILSRLNRTIQGLDLMAEPGLQTRERTSTHMAISFESLPAFSHVLELREFWESRLLEVRLGTSTNVCIPTRVASSTSGRSGLSEPGFNINRLYLPSPLAKAQGTRYIRSFLG
ncbi:hypothetical protein N657DRAFT_90783 [Parathielavia appendiculata]|uniref:Uncharacterized protein n=1 Tax=Parathielavia appendiculata TaxID=2587402 RepID=A0AAN6Z9K9_9PEZI|nr:hypothetical protein N657DRAFT_90783 [Parathielavia appendiculata]